MDKKEQEIYEAEQKAFWNIQEEIRTAKVNSKIETAAEIEKL